MDEFASDMLSINLITSAIAYILFFAALAIPKLAGYRTLMLLFSTTIILSTIGVEWLYNIYEEYQYITIRSFIFQIISVVMLFTCVKSEDDYMIYAIDDGNLQRRLQYYEFYPGKKIREVQVADQ